MATRGDDELRRIIAECCEEARTAGSVAVLTAHRQDRLEGRLRQHRREVAARFRRLEEQIARLVGTRTDSGGKRE